MSAAPAYGLARRRAILEGLLEDARRELAETRKSPDRYERGIEIPRLLAEIQRLELEIQEINED